MIGIFDSGIGGYSSLRRLKNLLPKADICYLADRRNAPYGTKSQTELERLVLNDVKILKKLGATEILAACCTASTVIDELPEKLREGVYTIIEPAASAAVKQTRNGRIAVICTYATAKSSAFERAALRINPDIEIWTQPSKILVELAEGGVCDGNCDKSRLDIIKAELKALSCFDADTVILGCTHFTLMKNIISSCLHANCVSAADEGARLISHRLKNEGNGKLTYVCPEALA